MAFRISLSLLLIAVALFALGGCTLNAVPVGATRTDSQSVERGAAEAVRAALSIGAGKLTVSGGAAALMNADFTYNVDSWKPQVSYAVRGTLGQLTVKQPSVNNSGLSLGNVRYEWNVRLNNDVPTDLNVTLGAGEAQLNLRDASITSLSLKSGASSANLALPAKSLTNLDITSGTGSVTVDLSGDWKQNLNARIEGGVGETTLRLPRNVGVRVNVQSGLGSVNAQGFTHSGADYTNAAYGASPVTLQITIRGGVGSVNLEQVD
jgi:N-terminal domain of toast_rack, DUF2154